MDLTSFTHILIIQLEVKKRSAYKKASKYLGKF